MMPTFGEAVIADLVRPRDVADARPAVGASAQEGLLGLAERTAQGPPGDMDHGLLSAWLFGSVRHAVECRASARFGLAKLSLVLVFALAASILARPAPAGAYLYWGVAGGIARADLDGGGLDTDFVRDPIERNPTGGVALSGRYIYFGGDNGLVGRADLSGGGVDPDLFTIPQSPPESPFHSIALDAVSLAVSETHIYWSSDDVSISAGRSIGRATIDGGSIEPEFIKTEAPARAVTVYAGHIYWFTENGIARANLDGSNFEPNFIPMEGISGIAVDGDHIYWSSYLGRSIGRANIDGRGVDPRFITRLAYVFGLAVGGGHIYWDAEKSVKKIGATRDRNGLGARTSTVPMSSRASSVLPRSRAGLRSMRSGRGPGATRGISSGFTNAGSAEGCHGSRPVRYACLERSLPSLSLPPPLHMVTLLTSGGRPAASAGRRGNSVRNPLNAKMRPPQAICPGT
jgi:hypothetical protein